MLLAATALVCGQESVGLASAGHGSKQPKPADATREKPFENSLGMRFVPVPGAKVLFSVWDTRVKDFGAFVKDTGYVATGGMYSLSIAGWVQQGATWKKPGFPQTPEHPVVGVSWDDAKAFCAWLTKKERTAGLIEGNQSYRLPKDEEWSAAVGGGKYPWGNNWPPRYGAGNYSPSLKTDDYKYTSAVGDFSANEYGLYDMGGNVWQWCEDWYRAGMNEKEVLEHFPHLKDDGGGKKYRVVRGGSWASYDSMHLLSSYRLNDTHDDRGSRGGFRCVLVFNEEGVKP
jgi:formylglycine-generating enzyme required for sulfatase activity